MSQTKDQVENINPTTRQETEDWLARTLEEYDWITKDKQKIVDALKEVQEKLRPFEDRYTELAENHLKDSSEALELQRKIDLLQAKLKELYDMYKK